MKTKTFILGAFLWFGFNTSMAQPVSGITFPGTRDQINLSGPYFGQPEPGDVPVLFAPSVIIPDQSQYGYFGITFSPDGKECFYGNFPDILTAKEINGIWTDPEIASFSGNNNDMEVCIAPGNSRLFFVSDRPLAGAPNNMARLWYTDRNDSSWSAPVPIDPPLRDVLLMFPSLAGNGNLYFSTTDNVNQWISVSRFVNGSYQTPEKLSDSVNFNSYTGHSFVAPDESYMIFDALDHMAGSKPFRDLFISFKKPDGSWTAVRNLGDSINTYDGNEVCPFVSRDNKYLFFSRDGNFFWVNAPDFLFPVGIGEKGKDPGHSLSVQSYPNPANSENIFEFYLESRENIRLLLLDLSGHILKTLAEGEMEPGTHTLRFDCGYLDPGVYIYSLITTADVTTGRMIIHK
jgi:hypothetical protein